MEEMLGQKTITIQYKVFTCHVVLIFYRDVETHQAFLYLHINSLKYLTKIVEEKNI